MCSAAAGDEFTGSLWDVVYKGAVTPLLQKAVGQDAMVGGSQAAGSTMSMACLVNDCTHLLLMSVDVQ